MKSNFFLILSCGCFIFLTVLLWQRVAPIKATSGAVVSSTVASLAVPSLNIDLPVIPASMSGKTWETTKNGVSWLSTSPIPGEIGNSIIYGHDWPNILGRLTNVKTGQEIIVRLASGKTRKFVVQYTAVVPSTQDDVLRSTSDRRLTIYTCTGFWDEKRFVAVAFPAI